MQLFREEMHTVGWALWIFAGCAVLYVWILDDPYTGLLVTVGIALVIGSVMTAISALAGLLIRLHRTLDERLVRQSSDDHQ